MAKCCVLAYLKWVGRDEPTVFSVGHSVDEDRWMELGSPEIVVKSNTLLQEGWIIRTPLCHEVKGDVDFLSYPKVPLKIHQGSTSIS